MQVAYCIRDSHSFEVRLADASEVEFNLNGTWKEVDCKYKELPASVTAILPAAVFCLSAVSGCKSIVTFDTLPANAQIFLTQYFSDSPISYAVKEFNEYSVILANGTEIEFNGKGEWEKVDMNHGILPDSVLAILPAPINSFLTASFANVPVEKIEKDFWPAYKVELVNGLELEFNSKGICKNIDD